MEETKELSLNTESREKEPKIFYHFFYSPHVTAKDFENLKNAFQEADLYIPEIYNWTPSLKFALNGLSKGELSLERIYDLFPGLEGSSARKSELEMIYNSKKPILLVDISAREINFDREREREIFFWRKAMDDFTQGNFQKSLQEFRNYIEIAANIIAQREKEIEKRLQKEIEEFLKQNPEYTKKENLMVLIRLGAYHTRVYQDLLKEGKNVSREFNRMPYIYNSIDEARRRIAFGKEVDDLLIARGVIESMLTPYLDRLTDDTAKMVEVARKLCSQLEFKDIEQISKDFAADQLLEITEELKKFNIQLPKSEEEMDKILNSKS
jgi:Tfp pilus assembly protein PilO